MTAKLRFIGIAALLALSLAACGGKECETCELDTDCEGGEGLICVKFQDGSSRCGSGIGATTCRSF
jgi:hypothetical protein